MGNMTVLKRHTHIREFPAAGGGWEIVYSGFILIVLCFFIMLCAFSTIEKPKIEKFVVSFTDSIDILKGGFGFQSEGDMTDASSDIMATRERLGPIFEGLVAIRNELRLHKDISLSFSSEGLIMRLPDTSLFGLGVAEISPGAMPLLNKIAGVLSKAPHDIRIEGHADNLPIHTAGFPSNWELSTARAVNVLRYFIETGKCDSKRLSAAGYGEFQPIFPNDTPEHRANNRRVEIIFSPK